MDGSIELEHWTVAYSAPQPTLETAFSWIPKWSFEDKGLLVLKMTLVRKSLRTQARDLSVKV